MSLSCLRILASKARLSSVKEANAYFHELPASYIKSCQFLDILNCLCSC